MASAIICLADNQKFNFSKRKQRKEAEVSHDKSEDEDNVPTPSSDPLPVGEDSSILNELMVSCTSLQEQVLDLQEAKAAQAKEIGRINDDEMFGVDDLTREEVVMNSAVKPVTTIKDSAVPTTDVTEDEITMAQTLVALKSVKPKVVVQEKEMSTTIPDAATIVTTAIPTSRAKGIIFHEQKQSQIPTVSSSKDKGKAMMIEPEVPLKKKEQMRIDEEYARKLKAKEQEATRLTREKEEFFEVEKARLLVELIEKRKKHFAALRAQEKRSKPPTKTQMKSQMCTYLRHMGGYKQSHIKGRSFNEIKDLFDKEMRKVDENVKSDIDDFEELRECIEIVPDDGDEVLIKATQISSRSPTIIGYKIHKEGKKNYLKIIRVDGNSQVYQTFKKMFKNFNREDLEVLWAIVKDKFKKRNQWMTWIIFYLEP
nr:hypothetical protein [Tanacetum cinerariifolium]